MTLSHKIGKIFHPKFYRHVWRRVDRILDPVPLQPILARIDQERLHELQEQHGSPPPDAPNSWRHYAKYLEVEKYLLLNIRRAQYLNLHRSRPKEILDIGCGAGFFLFVAQSRGHRGLGLDKGGIPVLDDLIELFGVDRVIQRIEILEPMPDPGRKFDLITAFSTAFHGGRNTSWRWGPKEWDFLVSDLERHLKPGGQVFLGLNRAYNGNFYTPKILDLFLRRGARVDRDYVLFPPKA